MKDSIVGFTKGGTAQTKDVMDLLVLNQYFDTLHEIGAGAKSKVVFTNKSDGNTETRDGMIQAMTSM